MKRELKMWWIRMFCIIPTSKDALELGLTHSMDMFGDAINLMNCRSLWIDSKSRVYRVAELHGTHKVGERCMLCHYIMEPGHSCIDKLTDEQL